MKHYPTVDLMKVEKFEDGASREAGLSGRKRIYCGDGYPMAHVENHSSKRDNDSYENDMED